VQSQDVAQRHAPVSGPVDVEQAEAALVEHYPRLVRLAYLVLPPGLGRSRRVLTAHALVQRALPRGRQQAPRVPAQSTGRDADPGYAYLRERVLRTALEAARPRKGRPRLSHLPPPLPQVWGLRLFPRSGGADELALDQRLSALSGPARAAYVLRDLEKLPDASVRELLESAGVADPGGALASANSVPAQPGLLTSAEFDPCSLQARPTDLMRRRQHTKAALAAAVALAVCGALVALPGGGWGPDGAAAPVYAGNPAAEAALDPGRLTRVSPAVWRTSARTDFSVWPARGPLTGDKALLRRALAVWARPGERVRVSATPGTQTGGPAGPPQLLYAGEVDAAHVVILYDGLRIARYAEPKDGTQGAALDFARIDGATDAGASALVLGRSDGNVRYLLAPWVTKAAQRDLAKPDSPATPLTLAGGVTTPLASSAMRPGTCTSWNALQLTDASGTRLATDLGELVPAHLTTGRPGSPHEASDAQGLRTWAPFACSLAAERSAGVSSVNAWTYAEQPLPDGSGSGAWVCTRAETWRGDGTVTLAQFGTPGGASGTAVAKATDVPACGPRDPQVLAGVLWKSAAGRWYLLAAGGPDTASVRATGGVTGSADGPLLAVRAEQGARAGLKATLADGRKISGLR
jgi:DNA-directed RNA polymerase specialized sigma24 family protein